MDDLGSYDDWTHGWQEVFDDIPGVGMFRDYEYAETVSLFERAFMHYADEPGYDPNDIRQAREEFFEYTGLPEELFPWDEWREVMGYDD